MSAPDQQQQPEAEGAPSAALELTVDTTAATPRCGALLRTMSGSSSGGGGSVLSYHNLQAELGSCSSPSRFSRKESGSSTDDSVSQKQARHLEAFAFLRRVRLLSQLDPGKGCCVLVFVQLSEKHGTRIERCAALIERVSA
eukprot:SAG31_NODE_1194_length_9448_cov_9.896887_4_plen_141_part_00